MKTNHINYISIYNMGQKRLWPRVAAPNRVLSIGQIDQFDI